MRFEVENANNARLSQLTAKSHIYNAKDIPGIDSNEKRVTIAQMERLLERLVAQKELELKVRDIEPMKLTSEQLGRLERR
jgi:hypothetical protein